MTSRKKGNSGTISPGSEGAEEETKAADDPSVGESGEGDRKRAAEEGTSKWGRPVRGGKVSKTGVGPAAKKSGPGAGSPGSESAEEENEVADDASVNESSEGDREEWGDPDRVPKLATTSVGSSGQKSTPAKSVGSSGNEGERRRILRERDARKDTRMDSEEDVDSDDISVREAVVVYGPVTPECSYDGGYVCLEDDGKCTVIRAVRSALKHLKLMEPVLSE